MPRGSDSAVPSEESTAVCIAVDPEPDSLVQIPSVTIMGCRTLQELLNVSMLQFSLPQNAMVAATVKGQRRGLEQLMHVMHLGQGRRPRT